MEDSNHRSKPMRSLRVGDTIYQINDHAYDQIMGALEPFKAGSYAAEEEKGDCLVSASPEKVDETISGAGPDLPEPTGQAEVKDDAQTEIPVGTKRGKPKPDTEKF